MPQLHNRKTIVVNHKYASIDISYLYFPGVLLGQASVAPQFKRRAHSSQASRVRRSMASVAASGSGTGLVMNIHRARVRPRGPLRAPLRAQTRALTSDLAPTRNSTNNGRSGLWTWNAGDKDDVCGICRVAFDACPPDAKFPGD